MNVYLHRREKFRAYLQRLQNQADEKPLILGEYGIDSIRNGDEEQAELARNAPRGGLRQRPRRDLRSSPSPTTGSPAATRSPTGPSASCAATARPSRPSSASPTSTGRRARCRLSPRYAEGLGGRLHLQRLARPSTGASGRSRSSTTPTTRSSSSTTARRTRCPRSPPGTPTCATTASPTAGSRSARNVGMDLATGEIVAYTDDDCFADPDWLYYLVAKLLETGASGVGGPNLLPTSDGPVAACVSASPGAPAHILARRQRGRARAGLQHGVLGRPAARHRRLRPGLHQGRRRRRRLLAAPGRGRPDRLRPGRDGLAPPPLHGQGLPEAAARLRRGRGAAEAQAPGEVPRLPRQPLLDGPDLHPRRPRPEGRRADRPPRRLRRRAVPDDLQRPAGLVAAPRAEPRVVDPRPRARGPRPGLPPGDRARPRRHPRPRRALALREPPPRRSRGSCWR